MTRWLYPLVVIMMQNDEKEVSTFFAFAKGKASQPGDMDYN